MKDILGVIAVVFLIGCFWLIDSSYEREGLGWTYVIWSLLAILLFILWRIKKRKSK